ncbi:MAG: toxin-antitoxin system HigA family antidote component [Idiomarinaceae bacterium HL-53]|nr:MAG: toxin-antitoxin system HigA family antidote component [Idiomarinaceae bacterium HL-53]
MQLPSCTKLSCEEQNTTKNVNKKGAVVNSPGENPTKGLVEWLNSVRVCEQKINRCAVPSREL